MFSLSWSDLMQHSKLGSITPGSQHGDNPDDFGTGPWSYEAFSGQTTPVYPVSLSGSTRATRACATA